MIGRRSLIHLSTALIVLLLAGCGNTTPPVSSPIPPTPAAVSTSTTERGSISDTGVAASGEPTPTQGESTPTEGTFTADTGFRPEKDGFSFENYGGGSEANLTAAELRRMFGDQVCASIKKGRCILTPPGKQWMQEINEAMSGGHCEGMAVLSDLFYMQKLNPSDFGATSVPELQLQDNEALQREIAYWWTTQATDPAHAAIVEQTPSGVVNTLLTAFAAGPGGSEQYAVGIYKRDRSGGHAITPYAVEDQGDGVYWIMVYDNNYPGIARHIEVNTKSDTWSYTASTNPSEEEDLYEGDADTFTLEIAPIQPRLDQQECPFCDLSEEETSSTTQPSWNNGLMVAGLQNTQARPSRNQATPSYNEIWLDGSANLLITDTAGRAIGFRDGQFVNEIPGARSNANKFGVSVWDVNAEPVYYIPTNIDFSIAIDANHVTVPTTSTVTMIGPGYALEVSDIVLEPGQVDTLDVSPDGALISYRTESSETPFMLVDIETDAADYSFGVYGEEMAPGEALNLSLNTKEGWLSVDAIDNSSPGSYSISVARFDDQSEQYFGADGVALQPDDILYIDYLSWPGNGKPMKVDIDHGSDGSVDETIEVPDVTDEPEEE